METVEAGLVFLPRFTTLVGAGEFSTAPVDVSRTGGVQFQIWRGPIRTASGTGSMSAYLEESLDAQTWALGPSAAQAVTILEGVTHFFSYSFRLRWFRIRISLSGTDPIVSCWAEGLLRGGDGGVWGMPSPFSDGRFPAGFMEGERPASEGIDRLWARLKAYYDRIRSNPRDYDPGVAAQIEQEIRSLYRYQNRGAEPPPPSWWTMDLQDEVTNVLLQSQGVAWGGGGGGGVGTGGVLIRQQQRQVNPGAP